MRRLTKLRGLPGLVGLNVGAAGGGAAPAAQYFDFFASSGATAPFYAASVFPEASYDPVDNKTWLCFEGWDGTAGARKARVKIYNHATKTFSAEYTTFTSFLTDDDHGVPAHCTDGAGYKYMFGGQHSGTEGSRCWSTTSPRDPTTFTARAEMGAGTVHSYPHPIYFPSEDKIFLFTRSKQNSGPGDMPLLVTPSTALGASGPTWGATKTLATYGNDSRFYQGGYAQNGNDIYIVSTRANYTDDFRQDVYLHRYRPSTGTIRNLDGTAIILSAAQPIDRTINDASFKIVDQAARNVFGAIPSILFDGSGNLHLVYAEDAAWEADDNADGTIYHKVWNGTSWSAPVAVGVMGNRYSSFALAMHSGGLQVAWAKDSTLGRGRGGSIAFRNRAPDGTWTTETIIKPENDMYTLRVAAVGSASDDMVMMLAENSGYPIKHVDGNSSYDAYGGQMRAWASDKSGVIVKPTWQPHARTQVALANMQVQPNTQWAMIYDELVRAIINNGDSLDGMYPIVAHDQQAAWVNLVGNDVLTKTGTLTFEAIPGKSVSAWKGGGGRLVSSIIPSSTPGVKWASTGCHIGIFSLTEGQADTSEAGTIGSAAVHVAVRTRTIAGGSLARISTAGSYNATYATGKGDIVARRTSSTVQSLYRDGGGGVLTGTPYGGALITDTTAAYSGVPTVGLCAFDGGSSSVPSTRQLSLFHFGGLLNFKQLGVLYQAKLRFLTAIGAIDRVQ